MSKYEDEGLASKLGGVIKYSDHAYTISDKDGNEQSTVILQHGNPVDPEFGLNGFTIEDLLSVALDRLDGYNKAVPDPNNACAILGIQQALLHLNKREQNRHRAGVKGTDLIIPKRERPVIVQKRAKKKDSK